ncbi:MAG: chemotaxis response regulator protein-glutamate methylesterase [Spirochaetales bacterium]|nr:chemotaxis response regulator protein-glutamate methylesterase [Spirochaetales bacterium]
MIIDDSAVVRQTITEILEADPAISVVATAADPILAANRLRTIVPDVIILDIEMPRMDGLTFLKKLMTQHPLPVIICSSKSEKGSQNALTAMEYGAVCIITKPKVGYKQFLEESRIMFSDAVKEAVASRVDKIKRVEVLKVKPKLTADAVLTRGSQIINIDTTEKIVVVGASTGGTEALKDFLSALPVDSPGIVIVQHMPAGFTTEFANSLNRVCPLEVKEVIDGDVLSPGKVFIAPGNFHIEVVKKKLATLIRTSSKDLVNGHRPSADVLFSSVAKYYGGNSLAVIMTGMGRDGASEIGTIYAKGGITVGQDEASSIVYGMPKVAAERGFLEQVVSLDDMAATLNKLVKEKR